MHIADTQNLLDRIENINWQLDHMTIHQIHNSERGQFLQDRLEELRKKLKE